MQRSYEADFTLEDTEELLDEGNISANADKKDEAQETKDKKFSFSGFLNNAKDKVDDAIDAVGEVATEKLSAFEGWIKQNYRGRGSAACDNLCHSGSGHVIIYRILKGIMGLKIPSITLQSVPGFLKEKERKRKRINFKFYRRRGMR